MYFIVCNGCMVVALHDSRNALIKGWAKNYSIYLGYISLLLPKLPSQCYSSEPDNLGNPDSNKEMPSTSNLYMLPSQLGEHSVICRILRYILTLKVLVMIIDTLGHFEIG